MSFLKGHPKPHDYTGTVRDMSMPDNYTALSSNGGELYCHVFENASTGLSRGLFWCVSINVEPPIESPTDYSSALTCEWLRWPAEKWWDLDGYSARFNMEDTEKEASMYWFTHHPAKQAYISLSHQNGNTFLASMRLDVQYVDSELEQYARSSAVKSEGLVSFTGLIMAPGNLGISPSDAETIDQAASKFVDLSTFEEKEVCESGFLYRPKLNP